MDLNNYFDKSNPFSVPENYFIDFRAKMERMTRPVMIPWYRQVRSWAAVAAAVAGIVIGTHFMFPSQPAAQPLSDEETYVLSQVDESALVDYLANMDQPTNSTQEKK
jgi:hypothetical protein